MERAHESYGYCQAGTSGFMLDGNAVVGTPGLFTWRGTIFTKQCTGEYLSRDKTTYYGPHTDNVSPVDKYSYLGMAVTGGRYFGPNISYVGGGKILIYINFPVILQKIN